MNKKTNNFSFINECLLFKTNSGFNALLGLTFYAIVLLLIFPVIFIWLVYMPHVDFSISQIGIVTCGASAIWLVGKRSKLQKWGYIMGLLGQPFWYITAIDTEQWGIFIIATIYTVSWMRGVYFHWVKK